MKNFLGGCVVRATLKYVKNCPLKEKSQVHILQVTSEERNETLAQKSWGLRLGYTNTLLIILAVPKTHE